MPDNEAIANAVERWAEELIDVGGRNRLLFYKPQRSGTIDFRPNEDAIQNVVERLLAGDSVRLSDAVPDDDRIMRRGRAIRQKSREHEEEQGIRTLYLGRFFASWSDKPGREPAAPIVLSAVEIRALGRLGDDFELSRIDDWEMNPSLFHYLRSEFQVEFDESALQEAIDSGRIDHALALFRGATTDVPELEIADRVVLGTFSYAKLPLVRDLQGAHDAISQHQLVAALTGDPAARDNLRSVPADSFGEGTGAIPDDPPPQDEFLILDADGSQSRVINTALHGRNLVVVGPPGTGKSQTTANLIATLTARGKSTLFVAEKRAAIEAVTTRLENAGLKDLVLDLHEGVRSRRQTAEQLAKALETARHSAAPNVKSAHTQLSRLREELSQTTDALHRKREPWGLSLSEIYRDLLSIERQYHTRFRITSRRHLEEMNPQRRDVLVEQLRGYIAEGGPMLDREHDHPWSSAHRHATVATNDQLRVIDDALRELKGGTFDDFFDSLHDFCHRSGIQSPSSLRELELLLAALREYERVVQAFASELGIAGSLALSDAQHVLSTYSAYEDQRRRFREELGIATPRSLREVDSIIAARADYERTLAALSNEMGVELPDGMHTMVSLLEALNRFDVALEQLEPSVFDVDLESLIQDLQPIKRVGVLRLASTLFSKEYRRARSEAQALARDAEIDGRRLLDSIAQAHKALDAWREIMGAQPPPRSWRQRTQFQASLDRWRSITSEGPESLTETTAESFQAALAELRRLGPSETARVPHTAVERLRAAVQRWSEFGPDPNVAISGEAREELEERVQTLREHLATVGKATDLGNVDAIDVQEVVRTIDRLWSGRGSLGTLPQLHERRVMLAKWGFRRFLETAAADDWPASFAERAMRHSCLQSILDEISTSDANVNRFRGHFADHAVDSFCQSDREHIAIGSMRVRRAWAEGVIAARNAHPEQEESIVHQSKLRTRHKPMRQLVREAPDVLTRLKPCWAMSPLLVPQILPCEQLFDVIIFDEASQILPADAVPSLLRGRQAVIAGDPRQLPPTTFFTTTSDDYEEEEEEDTTTGPLTSDVESVLDAASVLMPGNSRTLNWHYRSVDERLIAFSNHHIYDGSLTTFPGLMRGDCVTHVEVPFSNESVASGGSNSAEVQQVVDLILEHAEQRPNESLGVIAFGLRHAHRIEETLRLARADRPELDGFFGEDREEPFFVKNLERVQGDERDAIILAVGYGRSDSGRMRYNFGPLNREGGYRRLNVAVTRAKRRMTIVSAFSAADMDPDRLRSQGPQMLRDYIAYAASAGRDLGAARRDAEPLNPFEIDIKQRLEEAGIPLQAQYGASGYWIDFAAMHPDQPGRPVLAIEADGARYHSAINARERDRLRQEHLERLGWRFCRIWSTEWFRNPEAETERVVRAWKSAVAKADADEPQPAERQTSSGPAEKPYSISQRLPNRRRSCPHVDIPGRPIVEYSDRQLDDIVQWAQSDGLLHTNDELIRDIAQEMGYSRVGSRIRDHIERAITRVNRRPQIRRRS